MTNKVPSSFDFSVWMRQGNMFSFMKQFVHSTCTIRVRTIRVHTICVHCTYNTCTIRVHTYVLSHFSCVWLFATPWTVAHQAPLSMGFSRVRILEWAAISFSRGGNDPGIKPESTSPALAGRFFTTGAVIRLFNSCISLHSMKVIAVIWIYIGHVILARTELFGRL